MRNALTHTADIRDRIARDGCVLLLDFDGTLAPLVPTPREAAASQRTLSLVRACAAKHRTAIITGRTLADVEIRVGIAELWYAGSHGLEWRMGARVERAPTPAAAMEALARAKAALEEVEARFPGTIGEDKTHCYAVNYRALHERDAARFSREARACVSPYVDTGVLRVLDGLRTFEVAPAIDWTKGEVSRVFVDAAREESGRPLVPVYIGDSITDEDAFKALSEGITVRVQRDDASAAAYYVESRDDVDALLELFSSA